MKRRMLLANAGFRAKLYGYYPFSDNNDHTINPANISPLHTQFVTGKLSNCIEFLSTGAASARTSGGIKYSFTDGTKDVAFSLSFWIYYKGGGSGNRFIFGRNAAGSSSASTNAEYQMYITTTGFLSFAKYSLGVQSNSVYISNTSAISTNQWYYVVYTDDGLGNEKFYINGVLQSTTKSYGGSGYVKMATTPSAREGFGNALGGAGTAYRFLGMLDDFGIFKDYVLTQKDIDYIYNSGTGRTLK